MIINNSGQSQSVIINTDPIVLLQKSSSKISLLIYVTLFYFTKVILF